MATGVMTAGAAAGAIAAGPAAATAFGSESPGVGLDILGKLRGKTLFLTGGTGFVGKVLLEKLLRSTEVAKVFVLARPSKDKTPQQRVTSEVFTSPCFDRLRRERPDFDAMVQQRICAVAGDLLKPNLGMSDMDRQRVQDEAQIFIHCAASVEFNLPLYAALQQNLVGSSRVFDLASGARRIEVFVHVSTAYVNCNQEGAIIEERIYPQSFQPLELIQNLLEMPEEKVNSLQESLLGGNGYPNTYTFTKYLTENWLRHRRGRIPLAIYRPSIIGGAWAEPMPGWVDTVSAAGALYLPIGLGMLRMVSAHIDKVGDQVPVDMVVASILAVAAEMMGQDRFEIFHMGTSKRNPVVWGYAAISVLTYWQQHAPSRAIAPSSLMNIDEPALFKMLFWMRYKLPTQLFDAFSKAMGTGAQKKSASRLVRQVNRLEGLHLFFAHFFTHEWVFDTTNLERVLRKVQSSPTEAELFNFDVTRICWDRYLQNYCYGLQRFVLKETDIDYTPTTDTTICLVSHPLDKSFFADIKFAYYSSPTPFPVERSRISMDAALKAVLAVPRVEAIIAQEASRKGVAASVVRAEAAALLRSITADMNVKVARVVAWFLRKVWRQIYDSVAVDESSVHWLREAQQMGTVVFLPTHRSYVDFLLLSYVCFHYNCPLPHIAAGQDFAGIPLVTWVLQHCGAFFLKRAFAHDSLYGVIFGAYVQFLVKQGVPLEFFIEGTRSRTGRMLHPKIGLLHWVVEPLLTHETSRDIVLVPVNISYEKVLETTLFPDELLGGEKKKESLRGLIKARQILTQSFGRVEVRFQKPVSVKQAAEEFIGTRTDISLKDNLNHRLDFCKQLAYKIVYDLQRMQACFPTSLVSTLMLTVCKNGVFKEQLPQLVEWLRDEAIIRGAHIPQLDASAMPAREWLDAAMRLLPGQIAEATNLVYPTIAVSIRDPTPTVEMHRNGLVLAYYRNQCMHVFVPEAIVAIAFSSFASAHTVGVQRSVLLDEALFLYDLLASEFVVEARPTPREFFDSVIGYMLDRNILSAATGPRPASAAAIEPSSGTVRHTFPDPEEAAGDQRLHINSQTDGLRMSFFLNALLAPFVEAYVVAVRSLQALLPARAGAPPVGLSMSALVAALRQSADAAFRSGELILYESSSTAIVQNAVRTMQRWRVLTADKRAGTITLQPPYTDAEELNKLVARVSRFRRATESQIPATPVAAAVPFRATAPGVTAQPAAATATVQIAARL